jgi:hypothetical protein
MLSKIETHYNLELPNLLTDTNDVH